MKKVARLYFSAVSKFSLLWLFFFSFISLVPARGDERANLTLDGTAFYSAERIAKGVLGGKGSYFTVFRNGEEQYRTYPAQPQLELGTAFLSNDGRYLTWVLSPRFFGTPLTAQQFKQIPALIFFQDGRFVRSYSLLELLSRREMVSYSTSHTQWILEKGVSFASDGSRLEFYTTSLRHYVFQPQQGEMLLGEDMEAYDQADLILYGQVKEVVPLFQPGDPADDGTRMVILEASEVLKGDLVPQASFRFMDGTGSYAQVGSWVVAPLLLGSNREGDREWRTFVPVTEISVLYNRLP